MNSHRRLIAIGTVFLCLVLINVACGGSIATEKSPASSQPAVSAQPTGPAPVQTQPTPPPPRERCEPMQAGVWDCTVNGRKALFSNIPDGVTPFKVPFDENELKKKPTEDIKEVIVIVADIQFYDAHNTLFTDFRDGAYLLLGYTADDLQKAMEKGYSELIPIYTNSCVTPNACAPLPWRAFEKYTPEPENKQAFILFTTWLDQPSGFGGR